MNYCSPRTAKPKVNEHQSVTKEPSGKGKVMFSDISQCLRSRGFELVGGKWVKRSAPPANPPPGPHQASPPPPLPNQASPPPLVHASPPPLHASPPRPLPSAKNRQNSLPDPHVLGGTSGSTHRASPSPADTSPQPPSRGVRPLPPTKNRQKSDGSLPDPQVGGTGSTHRTSPPPADTSPRPPSRGVRPLPSTKGRQELVDSLPDLQGIRGTGSREQSSKDSARRTSPPPSDASQPAIHQRPLPPTKNRQKSEGSLPDTQELGGTRSREQKKENPPPTFPPPRLVHASPPPDPSLQPPSRSAGRYRPLPSTDNRQGRQQGSLPNPQGPGGTGLGEQSSKESPHRSATTP